MTFYDKNGTVLQVGDHIIPDDGMELVIVSCGELEEYGMCMFGQQVKNLAAFSILTAENLASQWTKIESN